MDDITFDTLQMLERIGWDALCASAGGDFYGRIMTPSALMLLVNAMSMDHKSVVASLNEAPAWDDYRLSDERLVPIKADSAALVYRAVATREGDEPFEALMFSTYVLIEGALRLALYQQTTATQ